MVDRVSWTFYGYKTPFGQPVVQEWFDGLKEEERDEAQDALAYLQKLPRVSWGKPRFEPLSDDISEVRFKVNILHLKGTYRIYGAFWPEGNRFSYTLLLGKKKKESNDKRGKAEAVERLRKLRRKEANIHEFNFENGPDSEVETGQCGSPTLQ
jgi:hypothetical protein